MTWLRAGVEVGQGVARSDASAKANGKELCNLTRGKPLAHPSSATMYAAVVQLASLAGEHAPCNSNHQLA